MNNRCRDHGTTSPCIPQNSRTTTLATTSCCTGIQYCVKDWRLPAIVLKGWNTRSVLPLFDYLLDALSCSLIPLWCQLLTRVPVQHWEGRKTKQQTLVAACPSIQLIENREPDSWRLHECRRSKKTETSHATKPNEASDLRKGQRYMLENWKKGERFPLFPTTTPPETRTYPTRKSTRIQVRL